MSTVYASVNISKKLKAVLKPGTAFFVETDDINSGTGRMSFEARDGIDPSVVAALGASSISIAAVNRAAPAPFPPPSEPNYPAPVTVESVSVHEDVPAPLPSTPSANDFVPTEDLVGGVKPVASFSGKKILTKVLVPEKKAKTAVREAPLREPHLEHAPKSAPKQAPAKQRASQEKSIVDVDGFYRFLDTIDYDPQALQKEEKRMSRSDAVKAEIEGGIGSGVSMYIVNVCGAQLVIEDLGIRLLRGSGYNLGSIPAAKLKASTHLFEALNAGQVKFVSREISDKARLRATKRQEQITKGDAGRDVYDKADDVYDEIEDGAVDAAAVNAVPQHLRTAASMDVEGDEEYETELDVIQGDVEARESELEKNPPPVEQIPGRRVVERETR